ncbi:NAD(P)H-dependent glycerol-3-phosphate dehydrogenase [Sphingoaurantiacus capsulatus]|uniref:Glycerol-3-phosphate dehydrogenase [NAD(P)+] n=1 Tax=Sphingoaurantiacus capsulatus TaxID=1771310 RepID=A0ABV7XEH9_9SPHN
MKHIGVIGGGAWGTALAQVAAAGGPVTLWAREPEVVEGINRDHVNDAFLAGVPLNPAIRATGDLADLGACDAWLVVTPAQFLGRILAEAPTDAKRPLVLCSKGIEAGSLKLMSEVAADAAPGAPIAVVSGPTFAHEVAKGLPTAVTLACEDAAVAAKLADRLAQPTFRPYAADDVIGAEVGGAVKNVLAIACGAVVGRNLGENAKAALIARGFAEMLRFGLAKGADAATLGGLSGLGDLVLTCSSPKSRNMSLGMGLGEGRRAADLLAERKTVAEGAHTAPVLLAAARQLGVDMPITQAVVDLLDGADIDRVIGELLNRPLRAEAV